MTTEYKRMFIRRDTAANFDSNAVIPNEGELVYETDTKKVCIGDGITLEKNLSNIGKTYVASTGIVIDSTDNISIDQTASTAKATTGLFGLVKPDGTTVTVNNGTISIPNATANSKGIVQPDGSTVTINNGILSAASSAGIYQKYAATTATINLTSDVTLYRITPAAATTFVFSTSGISPASDQVITFELKVTLSTVYSLTFPSSVKWIYSEMPDISSTGVYYFVFRTEDYGSIWYGNLQGKWNN